MAKIIGTRFIRRDSKGDEYEYEFDLDFKDQSLMEDRFETEVVAKRRLAGKTEWQSIAASLQYVHESHEIVVKIEGLEIGRIDTSRIALAVDAAFDEAIAHVDQAFVAIAGESFSRSIETAIQKLPVHDPVFGCLIKAGISTVAGQLARCIYDTKPVSDRRVRAIFRCLAEHGISMLSTAARRALWCMLTLGLS